MDSEILPAQELSSTAQSSGKLYQTDLNSSEDELLSISNEEGEEEAAWLAEVGLSSLVSVILEQGQIVQSAVLQQVADEHAMTKKQLKAVKKRVDVLNSTLRARKGRIATQKRPDCRDIFKEQELSSAGCSSRSRSATPDSLDADSAKDSSTENLLLTPEWSRSRTPGSRKTSGSSQHSVADVVTTFDIISTEDNSSPESSNRLVNQDLNVSHSSPDYKYSITASSLGQSLSSKRRSSLTEEPSFKFKGKLSETESKIWPVKSVFSLFATSEGHVAVDKGIEVLRYQQVGTLSGKSSFAVREKRSGSDPSAWISSSKESPVPRTNKQVKSYDELSSGEVRRLRQVALLEATALYDDHGLKLRTKKHHKKQSRNKSNSSSQRQVFGLPLINLLHRDAALEPNCQQPRILATILRVLENNFLDEEGILRVSGSRQKIAALQKLIDSQWYSNRSSVENSLMNALAHDLGGLLKLFLRMLPEPLLTNEYLEAFLQADELFEVKDKVRALSLLCVLLPAENRRTLLLLLRFLNRVAENHSKNRMNISNLATVISPSLFFPKSNENSKPIQKSALSEELTLIAQSNRITQLLILNCEEVLAPPSFLVSQLFQRE